MAFTEQTWESYSSVDPTQTPILNIFHSLLMNESLKINTNVSDQYWTFE